MNSVEVQVIQSIPVLLTYRVLHLCRTRLGRLARQVAQIIQAVLALLVDPLLHLCRTRLELLARQVVQIIQAVQVIPAFLVLLADRVLHLYRTRLGALARRHRLPRIDCCQVKVFLSKMVRNIEQRINHTCRLYNEQIAYFIKFITLFIFYYFSVDYFNIVTTQNCTQNKTTHINVMKDKFHCSDSHWQNSGEATTKSVIEILVFRAIRFNKFSIPHCDFRLI